MYADNTLTPKEAIRLCALGTLALGPRRYAALANAVRHFTGHMLGPSLDLMGTSIELLKYEGLIEADGGDTDADGTELRINDDGRRELHTLLTAGLRSGAAELNKLVVALKFRFLHLLDRDDQVAQADLLVEVCENELARLDDLRHYHADDNGYVIAWLDHEIGQAEARLGWLESFRDDLAK
jgi:DNA-binding PadR family transcriptional regulator